MKAAALPRVLLFEPHFVMRRTIVSVARDLGVAEVQDASTIDRARALLAGGDFDGVVLDFDEAARSFDLLDDLRHGKFGGSAPNAPVIALAADLRPSEEQKLEALEVSQILRKPFKIGDLLSAFSRPHNASSSNANANANANAND